MILLDDNLDALPDFLQHGMHIAGKFGFGNADGAHVSDHSLFSASLSSSSSSSSSSRVVTRADTGRVMPVFDTLGPAHRIRDVQPSCGGVRFVIGEGRYPI